MTSTVPFTGVSNRNSGVAFLESFATLDCIAFRKELVNIYIIFPRIIAGVSVSLTSRGWGLCYFLSFWA
jgi:hypothetical protein